MNKYKQNRDNITCNMNVETKTNVYIEMKQAVKWQFFRHVTEYNTSHLK